jgi:hypothetical protein
MNLLKNAILTCSVILLFVVGTIGQTITIGNGTNFSEEYPFDGYYNYNWSNVIYLASEINYSGTLNSVSFYVDNVPNNYEMHNQKILVRHTSDSMFANGQYPGVTGFTEVFEGTISYNNSGWKTITFDTPFAYNGVDNLEFLFENRDGQWMSGFPYFRNTLLGTTNYRTRRDYSDPSFPSTCQNCGRVNRIPNIQLDFTSCDLVSGTISATEELVEAGSTSDLTLNGFESGATLQWEVSTDNVDFYSISGATSSNYTTLSLYTPHYYRVKVQDASCFKYSDTLMVDVDQSHLTIRTIGTGTTVSERYPTNGYYNFGWSNFIYLSSEINAAGVVTDMSFYVDNTPSNYVMNNQKVFLRTTTASSYSSSSYPGTSGFEEVFEGTLTFNGSGWVKVTFDEPFFYDGVDNLEVLFENRDGSWASGFPYFRNTATGSGNNRTRYDYRDFNFPTSCINCLRVAAIPNVQMTIQSCTFEVGSISAENTTINAGSSAVLSAQGYDVAASIQWEVSSDNQNFIAIDGATNSTYTSDILYTDRYYRLRLFKDNCISFTDTLHIAIDENSFVEQTIGDGTAITYRNPFNNYYNFSYAMQIYTSEEVGNSGSLTKIAFNVANSPSNLTMPNQKIYVRHTTLGGYSSAQPSYPNDTSGFVLVYDGSITYNGSGWKEIVFDTPFFYNGEDNLEFRFENRAGFYVFNYPQFYFTSGLSTQRSRRDFRDANFPYNCVNCDYFHSHVNIKLTLLQATFPTGTLVASPTNVCAGQNSELFLVNTADSAALQWQYSTDGQAFDDLAGEVGTFYLAENLDTTVHYRVKVTKDNITVYTNTQTINVLETCPTGVAYETLTGGGSITVDISGISGVQGPFDYVVSTEPLPNKKALFNLTQGYEFTDFEVNIIEGTVDSSYLEGNNSDLTFLLDSIYVVGYYNIGVYDNLGDLIHLSRQWVGPEITYSSISGMDIVDGMFVPTDSIAQVTTEIYVDLRTDFNIGTTITELGGTQTIGLGDTATIFTNYSTVTYGFHIVEDEVFLIHQGELSSESYPVTTNTSLSIQNTVNGVGYFINGALITEQALNPEANVVTRFVLRRTGVGSQNILGVGTISVIIPNWFTPTLILEEAVGMSCFSETGGKVRFKLSQVTVPIISEYEYEVFDVISNSLGGYIPMIPLTGSVSVGETIDLTLTVPALYQVNIIRPFDGVVIASKQFTIGYPAKWREVVGKNVTGNATLLNDVQRDQDYLLLISNATSVHALADGQQGWYMFDPSLEKTIISLSTPNGERGMFFRQIPFLFGTHLNAILMSTSSAPMTNFNPLVHKNYRFLVRFTSNDIELYRTPKTGNFNPVLVGVMGRPSGAITVRIRTFGNNEDKVAKSIFSFGCGELNYSDIYVLLKRELNATYYNTYGAKFHFYFDNPYEHTSEEEVEFKLYTMNRDELAVGEDLTIVHRDNRFTLDLSGVSGLSVGEYYIFEATLPKGEKRYVKLKYFN